MPKDNFDEKFWKISKNITKKYPKLFKGLEEYDKTRKLPRWNYKKRVDFTIDAHLFNELKAYCKKKNLKMSNIVENLIRKELK
ncbi:MAG TPA: hypothetical protein VJC07_03605 [Candidatus Nanoarchaeia archaeon]|nr:hypothetical protein [Candidatus Nanoarchaeia archaeon]